MSEAANQYEKAYLQYLRRLSKDTNPVPRELWDSFRTCWSLCFVFLVIAYTFHTNDRLNIWVGGGLLLLSGGFAGAGIRQYFINLAWPFLKSHLNQESIANRLDEFET
jgi:hypothetical protein